MRTHRAACSCGQLSATAAGEPMRVSLCHCLACQRRTGSVFGAQARFPRSEVTFAGQATAWVRTADSGNRVTFHFCATCGATVYYELELLPDAVVIPIGAFADPTFMAPRVSVYEARKHPWVSVPEHLEHLD